MMMELKKSNVLTYLTEAKSTYNFTRNPELANLVHWRGGMSKPIHRWFRYREGYSPDLVTALNLGKRVLDPFSGSGSIMIGNAKTSREGVGIDINPLACFIAKTKITPLSSSSLKLVANFIENFENQVDMAQPWPKPNLEISEKLFEPLILDTILRLRTIIEQIGQDDITARDFIFLGWISILEPVGSYFKEGNGIKYRNKKRTSKGYVGRIEGEWQKQRFGLDEKQYVIEKFRDQLNMMLEDTWYWKEGAWKDQTITKGSATDIGLENFQKPFDSIIFSPPYANRFDYFESQKVELWFGNFVNSYSDMSELRNKSMRSHLGSDRQKETIKIELLENLINSMDQSASSWRMGVPNMLRGYFHDMFQTLKQCKLLTPNGDCHVIVGNSAFAGVIIPTDCITAYLGKEAGYENVKVTEVRHLTVSPQQRSVLQGMESHMRETIVSFS